MMHGREKSDSAIVAVKPTNKAVPTAAEPVEPRAGAKGNARQQSTHRTQGRERVAQALERMPDCSLVVTTFSRHSWPLQRTATRVTSMVTFADEEYPVSSGSWNSAC